MEENNSIKLDDKDKEIMLMLEKNGREQLKNMAKKLGITIDTVHNRIKKLQKEAVIFPTILIDPRKIGYNLAVDVKVKLKDIEKEEYDKLISYLQNYPYVISLFSVSGEYDLTLPIIAKNHEHLNEIKLHLRQKFKNLIADWKENLNLKIYKYEMYDMSKL